MVNYKGCQIVLLGDNLERYAVKSKIYKNAYVCFKEYKTCKLILAEYHGQFKSLELRLKYHYSRLNGSPVSTDELEPILKKGGNK